MAGNAFGYGSNQSGQSGLLGYANWFLHAKLVRRGIAPRGGNSLNSETAHQPPDLLTWETGSPGASADVLFLCFCVRCFGESGL